MSRKNLLLYIAKCLTGTVLVLALAHLLHYEDYAWCLISILLVLSPDSSEAIPLALNRIKANVAGGVASVLCLLVPWPRDVAMVVAVALTVVLCFWTKSMAGSRSALAAVIIIMVRTGEEGTVVGHLVLERVLSVIGGCVLGLFITFVFHRNPPKSASAAPPDQGTE